MGHAIEALAADRGHEVTVKIDKDDPWPIESGKWKVAPRRGTEHLGKEKKRNWDGKGNKNGLESLQK